MSKNKAKEYVAKVNFDDGSKRDENNGRAVEYKKGDAYMGDEDAQKAALEKGLICEQSDFAKMSEAANLTIEQLQKENQNLKAQLADAERKATELQAELDSIEITDDDELSDEEKEEIVAKEKAKADKKAAADAKKAAKASK